MGAVSFFGATAVTGAAVPGAASGSMSQNAAPTATVSPAAA